MKMDPVIGRIVDRLPDLDIGLVQDITELIDEYHVMRCMALKAERAVHRLVKEREHGHRY